jgi:hypothetical protein
MKNLPRTDLQNYQHIQRAERCCYDRGKIAGYQSTGVIAYEGLSANAGVWN